MLDSTLATKGDLVELRAELKADMWRIILGQTVALIGVIFAAAAWF